MAAIFDWECKACGMVRHDLTECPVCASCGSTDVQKVWFRAPSGIVKANYPAYHCPITGKVIDGRKAHEENLARHNCRVAEAGEKEAAERFRKANDEALDRAIEGTVEREIALMPESKRERLENELKAGADCAVARNSPLPTT